VKHSPALARLINALTALPGVGPKSAQRMAFKLLQEGRDSARELSASLDAALASIGRCSRCRMLTESELCGVCSDTRREEGLLCVVESPADVMAVEASASYRGRYFVLMGHLSPLDGIGPEQLGLAEFERLLQGGAIREVILATNPTVEGEATAHFLSGIAQQHGLRATRIAHGVPIGGELEYVDGGTLAHALQGRQNLF
jgi:recombination protein RecR